MTMDRMQGLQSRGERVDQRLLPKLPRRYKGRIVAIEPESGEFLSGKDELQVALSAIKKFPGKQCACFRVGYPAVHRIRQNTCRDEPAY